MKDTIRTWLACVTICMPFVGLPIILLHVYRETRWTQWLLND